MGVDSAIERILGFYDVVCGQVRAGPRSPEGHKVAATALTGAHEGCLISPQKNYMLYLDAR